MATLNRDCHMNGLRAKSKSLLASATRFLSLFLAEWLDHKETQDRWNALCQGELTPASYCFLPTAEREGRFRSISFVSSLGIRDRRTRDLLKTVHQKKRKGLRPW